MEEQQAAGQEAGKVHVGGYKKSDGTKVSEYERAPPGSAQPGKRSAPDTPTNPDGKREAGQSEFKRPLMTVEEYLELALRDQAEALQRLTEGDAEKRALVERDAAVNAAAPTAESVSRGPPGIDQFLDDVQAEAQHKGMVESDVVNSIMRNAVETKYNDEGGEWGKGSLVPHLQMAGLFDTALAVQSLQYKF